MQAGINYIVTDIDFEMWDGMGVVMGLAWLSNFLKIIGLTLLYFPRLFTTRDGVAPQGLLGTSRDTSGCHQWSEMLLQSGWERPKILSTTLQCTGQPPEQGMTQTVRSRENPD